MDAAVGVCVCGRHVAEWDGAYGGDDCRTNGGIGAVLAADAGVLVLAAAAGDVGLHVVAAAEAVIIILRSG